MRPVRCQTLSFCQPGPPNPKQAGLTFDFMIQQCLRILKLKFQAHIGMASRNVRDDLLNRGHIRRDAHGTERLAGGGDDIVADPTFELTNVEGGGAQKRRFGEFGGDKVVECLDQGHVGIDAMVGVTGVAGSLVGKKQRDSNFFDHAS